MSPRFAFSCLIGLLITSRLTVSWVWVCKARTHEEAYFFLDLTLVILAAAVGWESDAGVLEVGVPFTTPTEHPVE